MKKKFSIVIPIYRNEPNLPVTVPYIIEKMPELFPEYDVELLMVNDGSPDRSWEIMVDYQRQYPEVIRIGSFVRNFGQSAAIHYGVKIARGDAVGVISADLQDPLELFVDMLDAWKEGADLVCAVRANRQERGLNALMSKGTHRLINRFINPDYPVGGFDFFLMDRSIASRYSGIQEKNGSMQLLLLWLSNQTRFIPYSRRERQAGKSGWTMSKKIKYFLDTFISNSYLPLRVMSAGGIVFAAAAFLCTLFILIETLYLGREVPGWSSLAVLITFFSGLILSALGVIGEYLWRIYDEIKDRPLYIVDDMKK